VHTVHAVEHCREVPQRAELPPRHVLKVAVEEKLNLARSSPNDPGSIIKVFLIEKSKVLIQLAEAQSGANQRKARRGVRGGGGSPPGAVADAATAQGSPEARVSARTSLPLTRLIENSGRSSAILSAQASRPLPI
jgi:hypothetical protein